MSRYRCRNCDHEFESGEARCPQCLRKSTVRAVGADAAVLERGNGRPGGRLARFLVRLSLGVVLFFLLTLSGRLLGVPLEKPWMRWYAVILGALVLALSWPLLPKLDPARRIMKD